MASACVNNVGISKENFRECPPATFPWISPPISFTSHLPHHDSSTCPEPNSDQDPSARDFEFRLEDPVTMLPADELFSDGKLVPLHLSSVKSFSINESSSPGTSSPPPGTAEAGREADIFGKESHLFSSKAPRCSSRWKELLWLKKLYQSENGAVKGGEAKKTTSSSTTNKSLKHFLHRSSKSSLLSSSEKASLSLPLLKDPDCESVSIACSRLSISSSSSGHDPEDLPRLSLDSEKSAPNPNPIALYRNPNAHQKMRLVKPRARSFDNYQTQKPLMDHPTGNRIERSPIRRDSGESGEVESRGVSVESPRMNSSGKIVFQSLERSSSSPSSFNGGPRFKHRGMERSYSAHVRVTPVLNVPVCSLRGSSKSSSVFGFFSSSPRKKVGAGRNGGSSNKGNHHQHSSNGGNRHHCDRNRNYPKSP